MLDLFVSFLWIPGLVVGGIVVLAGIAGTVAFIKRKSLEKKMYRIFKGEDDEYGC